jgi:localization factor PodJL
MTSDMTWQARGARPQPLEAAREAARRSGMSVGEWLDSVILQSARQEGVQQGVAPPRRNEAREEPRQEAPPREPLAEMNARLDTLAQQLDRLAATSAAIGVPRNGEAARAEDEMPQQIASALSQLDRRLDQLIERRPRASESERPANPSRRASPAEPSPPAATAPKSATPSSPLDQALAEIAERQRMLDAEGVRSDLPRAPSQGFGGLEQQLRSINSRIESLKPVDGAVETLRDDLAEISHLIKEAMPRQAIEALEIEVRSLAQRIDGKRDAGANAADLAGIELGLMEVRDALRALTPAENLVGVESAVRAMSRRIDDVAAATQDPATLQHLEGAIAGLRSVLSHVASNDALARLSDEVRVLATKVEQVASFDILATLEQRITVIADALQSRPQADRDMEDLEILIQGLADKIERLQQASADHPNSSLIEEQLARLIEKIESSDARFSQLDKIERGLAELLLQIDRQIAQPTTAEGVPLPELDSLKRDVQRTHESIEAVHGTLGQVVDRLTVIETGIRGAPAPAPAQPASEPPTSPAAEIQAPDLDVSAATPAAPAALVPATYARTSDRAPIEPDLPPDHPLEPNRRHSPAERIAASQAALGVPGGPARISGSPDADAKANFIAAARRAAQAASTQLTDRTDRRVPELVRHARNDDEVPSKALGGHARFLLIAASVVMVVLGSLQVFTGFFSGSNGPAAVAPQEPTVTAPNSGAPAEREPMPAIPPSRQTGLLPIDGTLAAPNAGVLAPPEPLAPVAEPASAEPSAPRLVTGSVRQPSTPMIQPPARATDVDRLPASINGGLRTAAAKGDPTAEFEIAVRFAEGRGMPQNFAAAAEWFERAAKQGLAPAQFRLGGLNEKGTGVKKDLDAARRLYLAAAQAGNAKSMHNLAVLYAEGADGRPDYQTAAHWFRKAADHGVTDSQYNLGILYARGIGVETNLAEAYKWFALAAREGDRDSAKKRDELGTKLDQATAAAANAAVRAWVAEPQPEAATQVKTPAGGWDGAPAAAPAKRRVTSDAKATTDAKAPRATP